MLSYIEGLKPTYDPAAPRVATWAVAFTPPSDRQRRAKVDWMVGDARPTSGEPSVRILIRHVYLPPLRDALRELGSNSGERIRLMLANLLGGTDEIAKFEARAAQSLAGLNDDDVIKTLTTTVTEPLLAITSGAQPQRAEARLSDPDLASLARAIRFHLGDSLSSTADIRASGLGYANVLFIATVLAELQTAHENDLTVLLVEEPEAHLHPQLQTLLLRHLRKIASRSRGTAEPNRQGTEDGDETIDKVNEDDGTPAARAGHVQVVMTTHSPVLSAAARVEELVVCTRRAGRSHAVTVDRIGLAKSEADELSRYLDVTKSTMLYAPRTILVEGISEGLLLPAMAALVLADEEALARFSGASIIFADGVGFRPYLKILLKPENAGGITIADRVALITDADGDTEVPQRVNDAVKDVTGWGTAAHLEAFISHPTLEPELWHEDNIETLRKAFLACAPNSVGRFADIEAAADPAARFGELFVVKSRRADGTPGTEISKAQFAHALADRLSPKCGFAVPGYLADAIRYIASPSEVGG